MSGSSKPSHQDRRKVDEAALAISRSYGDALRTADGGAAERIALECLREGMGVEALYGRVIAPAMRRIGDLWERGAITIADEHLATAITHRVIASVYGSVFGSATPRSGRILLAAVEGQQHALGLRMAADVLDLAGYEVIYLGGDTPLEALLEAVDSREPDLVGLSNTILSETATLRTAVARLLDAHPDLPVLLGGQGIPEDLADDDRVTRAHGLEELVGLADGLIATGATAEGPKPAMQPDPVSHTGEGSAEGRLLGVAADAANLARLHARMAHSYRRLAYEDPITKGPNRRAFDDRLALLGDTPDIGPVALLILDLDRFKQVNDTAGHAAGDRVLREVFKAIESCLRDGDFAARMGGDEFGMLMPGTAIAEAEKIASRVLEAIARQCKEDELTATIGIAPLRKGLRRALLEADLALYRGKAEGGNSVAIAEGG